MTITGATGNYHSRPPWQVKKEGAFPVHTSPQASLIFLDAGFTLLHPHPSVGHFYSTLAAEVGVDADADALDRAFYTAWKACKVDHPAHPEVPYGITLEQSQCFWKRVVVQTFEIAGFKAPDQEDYYSRVFDLFATSQCWELYPDIRDGLDFARNHGVPLAIMSNWDRRLPSVVEGFGLSAAFRFVVTSSDAGYEKPSPGIFRFAGEMAQAHGFQRFALIGDEVRADVEGGREAGWKVCLLNRKGGPDVDGIPTAANLSDAIGEILRQWEEP